MNDMAESEEEKGFEVVDKRKVTLDEDGEVRTHPEVEESPEMSAEEQAAVDELKNLPPVDVYSLIRYFIGILSAQVWQWLGLVKSPITGNIERDLDQAKVAIDTISALVGQMSAKISPAEQAELQAMLSDLRINFVQQSSRQ
jgi:hypothetical protein